MGFKNYAQVKAVQEQYRKKFLALCPTLSDASGIYFLTRTDENDVTYFYVGQSVTILKRLCSHMTGFQHIDLALKKYKLYSEENPYGWKVDAIEYPKDELDQWEQYWILEYTKRGYQCRYNKTSGSQGTEKEKINEYRPARGYRDGLEQGYKNASKEIAHLFEKHLVVSTKKEPPTVNQQKALEKFQEFLDYYKHTEDNN